MSDDGSKNIRGELVNELAAPLYRDALQPAARHLGYALATIAKTINVALAPLTALVWCHDRLKAFLADTPLERIIPPERDVAGALLNASRHTDQTESLRSMYANLLAASMDRETARLVHPAYVEIMKNLTPDEARILLVLARSPHQPLVDVCLVSPQQDGREIRVTILTNVSLLGVQAGCEHPDLGPIYISNLCRLGLVDIPPGVQLSDDALYVEVENHAPIASVIAEVCNQGEVYVSRKAMVATDLGWQFMHVCVSSGACKPADVLTTALRQT